MKYIPLLFLVFFCFFSCTNPNGDSIENPINLDIPGEYEVNKSLLISLDEQYNASILFKIVALKVNDDLTIDIAVEWTATIIDGFSITIGSDYGNEDMNITDNWGKIYYSTDVYEPNLNVFTLNEFLENGESTFRVFSFPEPDEGITNLAFNDDDNDVSISFSVIK